MNKRKTVLLVGSVLGLGILAGLILAPHIPSTTPQVNATNNYIPLSQRSCAELRSNLDQVTQNLETAGLAVNGNYADIQTGAIPDQTLAYIYIQTMLTYNGSPVGYACPIAFGH